MYFLSLSVAEAEEAWSRLQSHFQDFVGFQVQFEQEVLPSEENGMRGIFAELPPKPRGQIRFRRDPKLSLVWQYEFPEERKWSFDGKDWWVIDSERHDRVPQGDFLSLDESFSFLWGGEHPELRLEAIDEDRFRLLPLNPQRAGFKQIEVRLEAALVAEAVLYDHLEGRTRYEFKNWKIERP
ncbi:MAG: outer membrane lipoprotein carrier protein LolA [Bradymonadales bacterium]|nr:MAG: outer membrane lipoprotein carrier protein LolA [Bradymonadales bacterium]